MNKILAGEKIFEFRRKLFKRDDVDTIVIYSSAPVQRVVAEASIDAILTDTPERLWHDTHECGGISYDKYKNYFHDTDAAYAIKFKQVTPLEAPALLNEYAPQISRPPQSFAYIA
ncbi:hypothetical protein [Alloscardovia venturai]|uniref:hypothetical protein n=1 Tax=Alloscardovia venturai TaxID=1769421 RepID=UPI003672DCD2